MNALADVEVGQYLNRHFVSAFQEVATFQINGCQKQGGNVAGYFCTPAGLVLHAVAGPVDAGVFLREARWANETYQQAQLEARAEPEVRNLFRQAHLSRLRSDHGLVLREHQLPLAGTENGPGRVCDKLVGLPLDNQGKVHLLLAANPTPPLTQVYRVVFETILNEKISTDPVAVAW